jgi:hypothetical protein
MSDSKCEICGMEIKYHGDTCTAGGSFAPSAGSATFVIKREVYPEHFMGFNEYGYTSWSSYEPYGLRLPADQIAPTMERIQATAHSNAEKLSAHLLPNDRTQRSGGQRRSDCSKSAKEPSA